MRNNFLILTAFVAGILTAQATPVRRETTPTTVDQSVVKYVDQSGKIDYASLYADTAASPVVVSIAVSGTAAAPVQTAALAASASEGATQSLVATTVVQPTGTPSRRRSVVKQQKRDVTPAWNSETCPSPGKTEGIDISTWDPAGFSGNSWISSLYGQNAGAPDGFARVYVGANGIPIGKTTSITQAITALDSYDVNACKAACDYYSCQSFSVFAVRDTEVDFSKVDLTQCNNPPPVLKFNCAVYGSSITKDMINETGQIKGNYFETAIAAANGYVRESIDKVIDGYTNTVLNGGTTSNGNTAQYLIDIYNPNENPNTVGYSPDLCAARCTANSQCQGFDAAQTLADGNFVGTQCLLYSTAISSSEGNNAGQWGSDGKWYSFQPSVFYAKNNA